MSWRILKVELPHIPQILVKARFDSSGYEVQLTDLSRLWSEAKTKDEVIQLARESGSSIDPSEDDAQFKIFLDKIESALNREEGTSLSVASGSREDGSHLELRLSAPLPQPLSPFKWTLLLQRQTDECIQTELVTPLILQSKNLGYQIQQLIERLHDKDRVISKICDRLETSGNDLTTVFPGVSNIKTSRKKAQREQLAKYVKGLEDFDEDSWRKHSSDSKAHETLSGRLIHEVFENLAKSGRESHPPTFNPWWEHLRRGSEVKSGSLSSSAIRRKSTTPTRRSQAKDAPEPEDDSMLEDEFQRQVTPPLPKPGSPQGLQPHASEQGVNAEAATHETEAKDGTHMGEESTTDEEDDLDAPPQKATPTKPQDSLSSPKRLGKLGGRTLQSAPTSAEASPQSEGEPRKSRSKLGTIGGKSKVSASIPELSESEQLAEESSSPKTTKMAMLGGKRAQTSASPTSAVETEESPKRPTEASQRPTRARNEEETPLSRETSQERADRKRGDLKRELEEKAKAPVKKKRKF